MNNKGFTLIELLAVMVILVSISLVAVISISESLARRDIKECKEQQELAIGAAKIYFSLHGVDEDGVTVRTLKTGKYFSDNKKTSFLNEDDKVSISDNEYLYNGNKAGFSCKGE